MDVDSFRAPDVQMLIVDDNEINAKAALRFAKAYGINGDLAFDGKQAVSMVQSKNYDLVLMDVMMPIMDGVEATRRIRSLEGDCYKNIPVIALSAKTESDINDILQSSGMNDYMQKPVTPNELQKCLLKWLPKGKILDPYADSPRTELNREMGNHDTESCGAADQDVRNHGVESHEAGHNDTAPEIEGLSVEKGIKYCGTVEIYKRVLGDYYKLIDTKSKKLEECLTDGLLKDYTIEVHALKNTSRMIGAMELSKLFAGLEKAGDAGDVTFIQEKHPEAMKLFQSYKTVLEPYAKHDNLEKKPVPDEKVVDVLSELHDAIDGFDLDRADDLMKELETFKLPEQILSLSEQLSVAVTDVAMEEILDITQKMIEMIRG